jgi:hypothetical protein
VSSTKQGSLGVSTHFTGVECFTFAQDNDGRKAHGLEALLPLDCHGVGTGEAPSTDVGGISFASRL